MVRQTTKVIVVEVLGMISLLLMAACAVLAFMLANGPVDLGVFRDDVERAITAARNGRQVTVDQVTLQWSPSQRRLFVVAKDVALMDASDRLAGRADTAELSLDAGAVFLGEVQIHRMHLQGGWLNLENVATNRWSIAGEPLPEIKSGKVPPDLRAWFAQTNSTMSGLLSGFQSLQGSLDLESVSFEDMDVRVIGIDGSELGRLAGVSGSAVRSETDIEISMAGEGGGVGLPGQVSVTLATLQNYQALRADLAVTAWPLGDLAGRLGLRGFDDGDLTAGVSFGASISQDSGVEQIDIRINRDSGSLRLPMIGDTIRELGLDLSYAIADDAILINGLDLRTDTIIGVFRGRIDNILAENALRRLQLEADGLRVDQTSLFPQAWEFGDFALNATVSDDFSIYTVERVEATVADARLQATAELDTRVPHEEGELPFELDLTAEMVGELTRDEVLSFWPVTLVDGARRFVDGRVLSATATEANVALSLRPDSLAEGHIRDTDLAVNFSFKDGEVKFLRDVPSIAQGSGTATLTGDTFSLTGSDAAFGDWQVSAITVNFPVLNERGAPFTVTASGAGPAVSVLNVLSESRLQLEERTGFDPERVSGDAEVDFTMTRPSLENVSFEDTRIEVKGRIENAGLLDAVDSIDLTQSTVQVDLTNDRLIITGFGDLGAAPVQFTWRDALLPDELPADLSATAVLTPDVLNAFGLLGRAYLTGEIPVELQGRVSGGGVSEAAIAFDLRDARIDVAEIGWIKPAGEPARATLSYSGDLRTQASSLRLESDNAKLDGDVLLADDFRLQSLTLRRLYLAGIADVSGTLARGDAGGIEMVLSGQYLDVSPALGDLSGVGAPGGGPGIAVSIDADVERLRLRRGLDLSNASLTLDSGVAGLRSVSARGTTSNGSALAASFDAGDGDVPARISLKSEDAGFLAAAFLGLDFIKGGELDLSGTLATPSQPISLVAKLKNTRLRDAPFFTQILSLASLRGLTDTLSGEGVMFSNVEAPITIAGGRYIIDGGRASGPALGLTVNGWIGLDGNGIEIDGVLVPSFGVNSMLGGVPVIGDLFVGRQGEGIFSITYSVRGTLQKAQVSVNPLSAVTPGILRRIFENPSDTSIPDSLPVDPNLKPPTEKLPELPEEEFIAPAPGDAGPS